MSAASAPPPPTGLPHSAETPPAEQSGRWKAAWFVLGLLAPLIGIILSTWFAIEILGDGTAISLAIVFLAPVGFLLGGVGSIVAGAIFDRRSPTPRGQKTRSGLTATGVITMVVVAAVSVAAALGWAFLAGG